MMPFPANKEVSTSTNYQLSTEMETMQKRLYSELENCSEPTQTNSRFKKPRFDLNGDNHDNDTDVSVKTPSINNNLEGVFSFDEKTEHLPSEGILASLVEKYFEIIHPWIPMIHEKTFRTRFRLPGQRRAISNILHAIVVATARFSSIDTHLSTIDILPLVKACRQRVMVTAMESISVENLQALIIIAFDSIGSGNGPRTWAVVDAMTRMVDHLRLSFEPPQHDGDLEVAKSEWPNEEERRRIFWNVFFLDRFCSVSAGWKPTIEASRIERRLPTDGFIFQDAGPARARYFQPDRDPAFGEEGIDYEREEIACLGGLSYSVEATEWLIQIAEFYIQKEIDANDTQAVQSWLSKFRKMDMQLVNWKKSLPPIWRNRDKKFLSKFGKVIQDPNLSLAHVTHNASVILLHQQVAFPLGFSNSGFIPYSQNNSLKICVAAATEILNATEDFMNNNPGVSNPQLSFCLFVAGRLLRAHNACRPDFSFAELFNRVVELLFKMSDRWEGNRAVANSNNLATKFARSLLNKSSNMKDSQLGIDIRKPAYSDQDDSYHSQFQYGEAKGAEGRRPMEKESGYSNNGNNMTERSPMSVNSTTSADLFFHVLQGDNFPPFFEHESPTDNIPAKGTKELSSHSNGQPDNEDSKLKGNNSRLNPDFVSEIESFLEDPQYMNLDRVWSFGINDD